MDNGQSSARKTAAAPTEGASRLLVIVNPATRRSADAILSVLRRHCPGDVVLDVFVTPAPLTALELTRSHLSGADVVVAVGGDGTVGEVASALVGTGIPLAIIPAGSTNIIAQELGIPRHPGRAARLLFGSHRTRHIDVGRAGSRCFLHMAGAGLDSRMFALANPGLKRRFGWLAYIPAGGRALFQEPVRFTLEIDGETIVVIARLVLIANGGSVISPRLRLMSRLRTDDGWLDVLIFSATSALPMARTLARMVTRRLDRSPYVLHRPARIVRLGSDPPIPVQLDGDVATTTPVTFEILPAALRVIVPARGKASGDDARGNPRPPVR
ncbi:MAG TPA: diacylglycerol kinase family protein [Thermomicrobiales bacterium]|nr:diacylglycerol kinase family protein [Thermomicrobiales bacterium]